MEDVANSRKMEEDLTPNLAPNLSLGLSPEMMLIVGQFLSRKALTDICCVNSNWAELFVSYSQMFNQRRVFNVIGIIKVNTDNGKNPERIRLDQQWMERFKGCCKHLEAQAIELVRQHFVPGQYSDDVIAIAVEPDASSPLRYAFFNQIEDEATAFRLLHLLSHIRGVIFEETLIHSQTRAIHFEETYVNFLSPFDLNPMIVELLFPIHTRKLKLAYPSSQDEPFYYYEDDITFPTLEMIGDACEMEELVWMGNNESIVPEEVELILEYFAIDKSNGGDLYKQLTIEFQKEVSSEQCMQYIQKVIQVLSSQAADVDQFVPRVKLTFEESIKCRWPLKFFANKKLIEKKPLSVEKVNYVYGFKETTNQGEWDFKVTAHIVHSSQIMLEGVTFEFS